jgi:hypothetical protein
MPAKKAKALGGVVMVEAAHPVDVCSNHRGIPAGRLEPNGCVERITC